MKPLRLLVLLGFCLLLVTSATWAGSRPPANALLLFRDGNFVTGDVFTINDRTVSMLTDDGIFTYDRTDTSQIVFLEDWNALVLKAEGIFVEDDLVEGELSYVGGVWDGRSAGTFTASTRYVSDDDEKLLINTRFDIVRNTMPRGVLETLAVSDGVPSDSGVKGYMQDHVAGVITYGEGDYADCVGTIEAIAYLDLKGPEKHLVAYYVFGFDSVH